MRNWQRIKRLMVNGLGVIIANNVIIVFNVVVVV